ncbi:MAG: PDZ domain-containing protein [Nitrospiraceae bacterium]|nr:PDZ domain-containing protein [Nitrospiraceae bacterium]
MSMKKSLAMFTVLGVLSTMSGLAGGSIGTAQAHESGPAARPSADEPQMPKGVIGVSLHVGAERIGDPAILYVAMVHPQGPAQQAGLQHGDEVTAVDGTPVAGKTYEQVILMVRGEPGKPVTLSVKGDKGARDLTVTRVAGETLSKGPMDSHGGPAR